MITLVNQGKFIDTPVQEFRGLSTDEKPDNAVNGSAFIEIDTGKIYFYNADDEVWILFGDGGAADDPIG